jgi:hypothetical protein
MAAGITTLVQCFPIKNDEGYTVLIVPIVFILIGLSTCYLCCWNFIRQVNSAQPMIRAVEDESKKYESQHCQWHVVAKRDEPTFWTSRNKQPKKFHVS